MMKVLCLSFRTPPTIRPQAILIGKMIPEWIRQGIKPIIVTYEQDGEWKIDAPIFTIPQFEIKNVFLKLPLIREIFKKIYYIKVLGLIKEFSNRYKPDIIFSFSNPQESNIIGAKLKKILKIPFISHFSDPWFDNPYNHYSALSKKITLLKEKKVIENSDKIIFVNDRLRDLVMRKYTSFLNKTEIIPHCFDINDFSSKDRAPSANFIFSYIGAFYKQRNPEIIFKAFNNLLKENKNKYNFKIKLIGSANDYTGYPQERIKQMINEYGLGDKVSLISTVSYLESLVYMKNSDCLIVIDANIPDSPFLPSKLIDYAASGTTILGITPDNSPTAEFLTKLGYKYFNYQQIEDLTLYLDKLINKKCDVKINTIFLDQFNVVNTTKKLLGIFNELVVSK